MFYSRNNTLRDKFSGFLLLFYSRNNSLIDKPRTFGLHLEPKPTGRALKRKRNRVKKARLCKTDPIGNKLKKYIIFFCLFNRYMCLILHILKIQTSLFLTNNKFKWKYFIYCQVLNLWFIYFEIVLSGSKGSLNIFNAATVYMTLFQIFRKFRKYPNS